MQICEIYNQKTPKQLKTIHWPPLCKTQHVLSIVMVRWSGARLLPSRRDQLVVQRYRHRARQTVDTEIPKCIRGVS